MISKELIQNQLFENSLKSKFKKFLKLNYSKSMSLNENTQLLTFLCFLYCFFEWEKDEFNRFVSFVFREIGSTFILIVTEILFCFFLLALHIFNVPSVVNHRNSHRIKYRG